MNSDFHRIRRLPPYVFEQVNKLKAQARARGEDIIDFGMGNPDMPTPDHIVQKLVETVRDPRTSRYSASRGIQGLRRAQGQAAGNARTFAIDIVTGLAISAPVFWTFTQFLAINLPGLTRSGWL